MNVSISLTGLDQFTQKLRSFPTDGMRKIDDTKLMPPVSAKTTGYDAIGMPVDTGLTRQMIVMADMGYLAAQVYAGTGYSGFIDQGTSKMPARPFFQWALEKFHGLQDIADIVNAALSSLF
jgi:hypothetical protein